MKKYRLVQLISGVNYIHHYVYSYGFKLPFFEFGYFKKYGWKQINKSNLKGINGNDIKKPYHNCTLTGIY
jgi:hypothetical protein